MLKKGFRLRKKEDFDNVFRFGKPLFFGEIGCKYLANKESLRLGFSLSKKHLANAVDRNRLKRRLTAAFGRLQAEWPAADIVFFTTKKPQDDSFETLLAIAEQSLQRINKNKR